MVLIYRFRACLKEGKDVTRCTNNFFRMVKRSCAHEFTQYATCLDKSNNRLRVGLNAKIFKKQIIEFGWVFSIACRLPKDPVHL